MTKKYYKNRGEIGLSNNEKENYKTKTRDDIDLD